jgi:hypothetical protein
MSFEATGTLVGYDADNGEKLFTHNNRAILCNDKTSSLPLAGSTFEANGKRYQIVGVRKGSTEIYYEVDVRVMKNSKK